MPLIANQRIRHYANDLRLSDYANASLQKGASRVSKSVPITTSIEAAHIPENWWEDAEDDPPPPPAADRPTLKQEETLIPSDSYAHYPIDLWFLLASYTHPESLWIFASLCKSASSVLHTPGFWRKYYARWSHPNYYDLSSIRYRLYGLRPFVIRSLFRHYSPFKDRILLRETGTEQLTKLLDRGRCVAFWNRRLERHNGKIEFLFKFSNVSGSNPSESKILQSGAEQQPVAIARSWLRRDESILHNIWANSEAGMCLVRILATEFAPVPPAIMSSRLVEVSFGLSPKDIRTHRLKLVFSSAEVLRKGAANRLVVVIDGVQKMSVFDWWHPEYPVD